MTIQLKEKVAIITGGTRGIGLAIVKSFLRAGAQVIFLGSKEKTVSSAMNELSGQKAEGYVVDASDEAAIDYFVKQIQKKYGHIDILVNNAGVTDIVSFVDYEPGRFENIMDINVNFMIRMSKAVAKLMIAQHNGVILNTSSMVSFNGQATGIGYPASKYAVNGITVSLARELGKYGIRVNAIAPGVTYTDMVRGLNQDMIDHIASTIPLGRMAKPEDIAHAFLFLASDMASYISGAILRVDGGAIT